MSDAVTTLEALGERVIISLDEVPEYTKSGLLITALDKEKPQSGSVVAVGAAVDLSAFPVQVGDRVYFAKYAGAEITIEGDTFYVLSVSDLLARVIV